MTECDCPLGDVKDGVRWKTQIENRIERMEVMTKDITKKLDESIRRNDRWSGGLAALIIAVSIVATLMRMF